MKNYLNFETDIKNLESELDKLKDPYNQEGLSEVDTNKISKIQDFRFYPTTITLFLTHTWDYGTKVGQSA